MENKVNEQILKRFIEGKCSEKERYAVLHWIKYSKNKKGIDNLMNSHWNSMGSYPELAMDQKKVFERIRESINSETKVVSLHKPYNTLLKIASVFIGTLLISIAIYLANQKVVYETHYGQIMEILLPDSSEVLLNGNSKLSFANNWTDNTIREVDLEGEAYFNIKHTSNNQKFIVHTSETLSIEVLGTKFNVSNRKSGTQVTLAEGSILLNIQNDDQSKKANEKLLLEPGEHVRFKEQTTGYTKRNVKAEQFTSWKENKLTLDNTSLRDLINYIENTHGFEVSVSNPELLELRGSGTMPSGDFGTLIQVVAETFHLSIKQESKKVYLYKNP